jgi:5-methylcytosine-specific restriction endonuclease McrA
VARLDVLSEAAGPTGEAPSIVATNDLARAVLDIYWPHTRPFEDIGTLRQNQSGQAEILSLIARFQERTVGDATAPPSRVRIAAPEAFEALVCDVEWKLIEMPLGRLQRIGNEDEPFIYTLGWDQRPRQSDVRSSAFKGYLRLLPDAGDHMLRSAALLRPLVQRSWTLTVARFNGMQEAELEAFLFGTRRVSLAAVAPGLRELAAGECFYCRKSVQGQAAIDHFIPWTRHIDNGIENLVYAHSTCNSFKSASLAAESHVERWMSRMADPKPADALRALADEQRWESHPDKTQAVARSIYLRLPDRYKLWQLERDFTPLDQNRVAEALLIQNGER